MHSYIHLLEKTFSEELGRKAGGKALDNLGRTAGDERCHQLLASDTSFLHLQREFFCLTEPADLFLRGLVPFDSSYCSHRSRRFITRQPFCHLRSRTTFLFSLSSAKLNPSFKLRRLTRWYIATSTSILGPLAMMLLESILSILTFITFAPRSLALPPGIPVDTVESEAPSPGDAFPGLGYSSLPGEPADRRDDTPFANLCREVTLGGHGKPGVTTIDGKCIDALSGLWWETSLNLNKCLGNAGGRLVYMAK